MLTRDGSVRGRRISPAGSDEVEIVGFDAELLDRAADLRSRVWGDTTEVNRDYLAWKYTRNPYFVEPLVQFATCADDVVGMYGSMGTCWELHGDRHVLGHGGDVVVDPRFRRRGLARRLQQAYIAAMRARGLGFAFSFSTGSMGTPTMVAGGWQVVAVLDTLDCAIGPPRVVARGHRLIRRMRRTSRVDPLSTVTGDEDGHVELLDIDASDRLARIASLAPTSERLRHVRDEEYFRWRLANPLHRYRVLASQNSFVILESSGPGSRVNLVDWSATGRAVACERAQHRAPPDPLGARVESLGGSHGSERPGELRFPGGRRRAKPVIHHANGDR